MKKTHDYVHHYSGYRSDGGRCRIRIYREDRQAPVVICSQLPDNDNTSVTNMAEYLAAEAVATPTVGVWEKRGGGVDGLRTRLAADSRYRPAIAERRHRMIGKLLSKEETSAALVLALSGALMVLVAKGDRPLPLGRIVSRTGIGVDDHSTRSDEYARQRVRPGPGSADRRLRIEVKPIKRSCRRKPR